MPLPILLITKSEKYKAKSYLSYIQTYFPDVEKILVPVSFPITHHVVVSASLRFALLSHISLAQDLFWWEERIELVKIDNPYIYILFAYIPLIRNCIILEKTDEGA